METSAEKSDRMFLLFAGIVSLILGILLFTQTGATLSVVMLLVGLSWFIWGIFSLLSIFIDKKEWGWRLFGGVIGIAAGWLVLSNPVASTVAPRATNNNTGSTPSLQISPFFVVRVSRRRDGGARAVEDGEGAAS